MIEYYRSKSSFSPTNLEEFIETKNIVALKNAIFTAIRKDPLFQKASVTPSLGTIRKLTHLRSRRLIDYGFLDPTVCDAEPIYITSFLNFIAQYDLSVLFKTVITTHFFGAAIRGLGLPEQQCYYADACSEKISGCFALTEIGHGTDAKRIRTTATYDHVAKKFILHSEDFLAAKCWIGNMGQSATHAVVFAQLITANGQNQGLHGFITPIRDPETFLPYPGVIIGDMGEKLGLQGMDNGFCMFNQYVIPKENLLSKFCTITDDGDYYSPIKDPRKRFALSLGSLISGRIMVLNVCVGLLTNAVTIAIRYSATRKQFGPNDGLELAVIEYPLQQWRLFPYLAALFAMKATCRHLNTIYFYLKESMFDPDQLLLPQDKMECLMELHPLMSALKAVFSWTSQDAIQQCREACGGHGYLQCAGLGDLRNNNDGNSTYEGDNNVLQQQASNWLVGLWQRRHASAPPLPLRSALFFYQTRPDKMAARTEKEIYQPPVILEAYQWLVCWLAEKTVRKLQSQLQQGKDTFTAKNHSQIYCARSLAIAYGQHYILQCFWEQCCNADQLNVDGRTVLTQLCSLYGLSSLNTHLICLHQGGYVDAEQSELVQSAILSLCERLKDEAVSIVDVVAPPDHILNSVLGNSDGDVYRRLEQTLLASTGNLQRPEWWTELSGKLRSRL